MSKLLKKRLLSLAAVALMMSACTQDVAAPDSSVCNNADNVSVSAVTATRTAMSENANGSLDITWVAGDAIGLSAEDENSIIGTNVKYTANSSNTTTTAFTYTGKGEPIKWGQGDHKFYAYYPYTEEGADYTAVSASVPAVQTQAAAGSTGHMQQYAFMYAPLSTIGVPADKNIALQFRNAFSVLELSIYAEADDINCESLIFRANDESEVVSAEGVKVNLTDGSLDYTSATTSPQIQLNLSEDVTLSKESAQKFYLIITPGHGGKQFKVIAVIDGQEVVLDEMGVPESGLPAGVKAVLNLCIPAPGGDNGEGEELDYELRVLTFEDDDAKFEPYSLDYAGVDIATWSDLIDSPQYGGPLTYGDYMSTMYTWWDENNTELTHTFPDNYAYCFWGGGHAISHYWGEGYSDEDRDLHIAKYYGDDYVAENAGNDQMLGWFNLQLMTPVKAHSGDNFCVHYGYKDFFSYVENLPELSFADGEARVIDHMWVTNTNYTLNQLYNGVKSEAGNTFGGNWEGLTESAWMKIIAQGFDDVDADAYAEPISEVEFYLVQGVDVVTDWQKWDLSVLGKVAKVRFNFAYSDEMGGRYGFTIPGYFAYDDVAVRFDK